MKTLIKSGAYRIYYKYLHVKYLIYKTNTLDEGGIQCCLGDGRDVLPQDMQNDKCIPICVPEDDPFYRNHGIKCLNFVRSVTTPRDDCSLGHAEQVRLQGIRNVISLNVF